MFRVLIQNRISAGRTNGRVVRGGQTSSAAGAALLYTPGLHRKKHENEEFLHSATLPDTLISFLLQRDRSRSAVHMNGTLRTFCTAEKGAT